MWHYIRLYIPEEKIKMVFGRLGYQVETVRHYLKREFNYKDGKDIQKDLDVKKSFLDVRLVYKDSEIPELNRKLSLLIDCIRRTNKNCRWSRNSQAITMSLGPGLYNVEDTVGKYEIKYRFKTVLEEVLEIDPKYFL